MALVWGGVIIVQAQDSISAIFCSPFDFPLLLSANFGEVRANHFHNGLDIKTQGVVGKPIHSIADAYVSRILVLHGGYGQALFITHPNGYTSVYGHVVSFAPQIQKYLRQYQYEHETFVCDVRPEKCVELLAKHDLQNDDSIKRYEDYKKMIEEIKPELVSIATESGIHAEIALYCIEKGVNLIIEKPMAMSIDDAD